MKPRTYFGTNDSINVVNEVQAGRLPEKQNLVSRFLDEHVQLLGAPQVVVTRAWAWRFYVTLGHPKHGGFASADYMAYGAGRATQDPLTDLSEPWVVAILTRIAKDCCGVEYDAKAAS